MRNGAGLWKVFHFSACLAFRTKIEKIKLSSLKQTKQHERLSEKERKSRKLIKLY